MKFTALLNYYLIDDGMFISQVFSQVFHYSNLTLETGGFERTSTITLVLHANQLINCTIHSKTLPLRCLTGILIRLWTFLIISTVSINSFCEMQSILIPETATRMCFTKYVFLNQASGLQQFF